MLAIRRERDRAIDICEQLCWLTTKNRYAIEHVDAGRIKDIVEFSAIVREGKAEESSFHRRNYLNIVGGIYLSDPKTLLLNAAFNVGKIFTVGRDGHVNGILTGGDLADSGALKRGQKFPLVFGFEQPVT